MNINTHGITLNAFANICIKIYIKKKKIELHIIVVT